MKKVYFLLFIAVLFQFCATKKKVAQEVSNVSPKVTYAANVQGILTTSCSPCHFPPQGNKEPLNTYVAAKSHIDEIIRRTNLAPTERGFMPQRHPKLADSVLQVFAKWKADGLLEK
jgi:hypothetical protein